MLQPSSNREETSVPSARFWFFLYSVLGVILHSKITPERPQITQDLTRSFFVLKWKNIYQWSKLRKSDPKRVSDYDVN